MATTKADKARDGMYLGAQIDDRQVSELIGLARGLIADNELNDHEIEFLHKWLVANDAARANPMLAILLERIRDIYADGYVDESERGDLIDVLRQFTANDFELGETLKATSLPLTDPAPNIDFEGKKFCFTGTFVYGKRSQCEALVTGYGGICTSTVSWGTNYLVIGEYATAAWAQSSFGRKIEAAAELRSKGADLAIIPEHHWRMFI